MIERLAWALLALVHITPALALIAPSTLTRLYGVQSGEPLFLLMHHRAALFLAVSVAGSGSDAPLAVVGESFEPIAMWGGAAFFIAIF